MSLSVYKPNPLAYPGYRQPGFDPTHPAANLILPFGISCIALQGGIIDILNAQIGTNNNTASITAPIFPIGPTVDYADPGASKPFTTIPTGATGTPGYSSFVAAAIIYSPNILSGAGNYQTILMTDTGTWFPLIVNGGLFGCYLSGDHQSTIALSSNIPYFLITSWSNSSTVINVLVLNLNSGQVFTQSLSPVSVSPTLRANLTTGSGNSNHAGYALAAIMFNPNQSISMPQMQAWAADPWAFWYPRTLTDTMNNSTGTVIAAASNPIYPKFINHASLIGMAAAGAVISNPKVTRRLGLPRRGKKR